MNAVYIRPADGKCSDCGQVKELRPYGKNGAFVCFECANEGRARSKATIRQTHQGQAHNHRHTTMSTHPNPASREGPTPRQALHAMSCEYPEGCSCGASKWNSLVNELTALRAENERLKKAALSRAEGKTVT